jgi:hypothetical protein
MFTERLKPNQVEQACLQCGYRLPRVVSVPTVLPRTGYHHEPFMVSEYVTKKRYLEKLGSK